MEARPLAQLLQQTDQPNKPLSSKSQPRHLQVRLRSLYHVCGAVWAGLDKAAQVTHMSLEVFPRPFCSSRC